MEKVGTLLVYKQTNGANLSITYRAGKTSCIKTVFQQVPAVEVPHFGVTQKIEQINYKYVRIKGW